MMISPGTLLLCLLWVRSRGVSCCWGQSRAVGIPHHHCWGPWTAAPASVPQECCTSLHEHGLRGDRPAFLAWFPWEAKALFLMGLYAWAGRSLGSKVLLQQQVTLLGSHRGLGVAGGHPMGKLL